MAIVDFIFNHFGNIGLYVYLIFCIIGFIVMLIDIIGIIYTAIKGE
jgi:hypothetical protein